MSYDFSMFSRLFFSIEGNEANQSLLEPSKHEQDMYELASTMENYFMVTKCENVGEIWNGVPVYEIYLLCNEKHFGCLLTAEEFTSYFKLTLGQRP
jgi:hypothetical protein